MRLAIDSAVTFVQFSSRGRIFGLFLLCFINCNRQSIASKGCMICDKCESTFCRKMRLQNCWWPEDVRYRIGENCQVPVENWMLVPINNKRLALQHLLVANCRCYNYTSTLMDYQKCFLHSKISRCLMALFLPGLRVFTPQVSVASLSWAKKPHHTEKSQKATKKAKCTTTPLNTHAGCTALFKDNIYL